jgi:hypothetical protein
LRIAVSSRGALWGEALEIKEWESGLLNTVAQPSSISNARIL